MVSTRPVLSIIVVTYNSAGVIGECLESIRRHPPSCQYEVVIIDNGSSDDTRDVIARFQSVHYVENNKNLGFAGGNALAVQHARGDLLLLLNPDTIVLSGSLDKLVNALLQRDDAWIAGGCLLNRDGAPGTAWGDFPSIGWALLTTAPFARLGIHARSRCRMGMTCSGMTEITSVGWVSGASFLIRRSVWQLLGGLCTDYFMYFEETDLCYRAHEAGGDVVLVPDARIIHLEGAAVGQAGARQRVWFTDGLIRFISRNGPPFGGCIVSAWVAAVNSALWIASWPAGVFSGHARRERKRYAALVRTGFRRRVEFGQNGEPL